jgi:hypothetical protein
MQRRQIPVSLKERHKYIYTYVTVAFSNTSLWTTWMLFGMQSPDPQLSQEKLKEHESSRMVSNIGDYREKSRGL